ncbi:MAG: hypothetical protein IIA91_00630 [Chloroflexi bacterium]|nr:hypothetical protein [Chloroflexota bacterium]
MTQQADDVEEPKADPVARFAAGVRAVLPQFLLLGRVRPPGQPRPYEPRIATLSESRAAAHVRAVKDIAEARFGFPTDRYRDYKTYSNIPQRSMGVAMPDDAVAYPDVVVVQNPENYAKIIGEVETAETVSEEAALRRWLPFAELAPLYLYVPVGEGDLARKLCRDIKVAVVGIRTWRYTVGVDQIEINDYFTVPSGPEEMLPKILRPS